jgi:phosphosulfolactate synthase (CoM biosynthesis protein A)
MGIRGDLQLLERAVKQRWLTEPLKPQVIETLKSALTCGDVRAELRAAQILVAMESQNQNDEHKAVDVRVTTRHDRLDAIAADLGIDRGTIEAVTRSAIGGDCGDAIASGGSSE